MFVPRNLAGECILNVRERLDLVVFVCMHVIRGALSYYGFGL